MTRTRHLTRTAVFATSSALLALAATGTAAAWTRSATSPADTGSTVAAVSPAAGVLTAGVVVAASATASSPTATAATPRAVQRPVPPATPTKAAQVTTQAASARTRTANTVTIRRYTYAPGSQRAIDRCKLVLWATRPMWLAAHNYCGYQWLASVPTGRTIKVTTGRAAGTYVVTGHLRLSRQSGSMPRVRADLVLQTCVGSGTGLTLARRVR